MKNEKILTWKGILKGTFFIFGCYLIMILVYGLYVIFFEFYDQIKSIEQAVKMLMLGFANAFPLVLTLTMVVFSLLVAARSIPLIFSPNSTMKIKSKHSLLILTCVLVTVLYIWHTMPK